MFSRTTVKNEVFGLDNAGHSVGLLKMFNLPTYVLELRAEDETRLAYQSTTSTFITNTTQNRIDIL